MTDKRTPIQPITHADARLNIPTPELAPMMDPADAAPIRVAYDTRNPDLDPQLIWRGKDIDQMALTVDAPPIYLQEQVHPKAIIEDLRAGGKRNGEGGGVDLFDHFGVADEDREAEIEFYRHHRKWSNRMILGDGLQVMASLAEREGLKGQVQAIYIDPPYGIKFNSNFQWSTTSRDVKDGNLAHLTREPEQVKAFRDTWRDGIHSYLQYLRDRLVVARELLTESGSCFVQIGDENVHRVHAIMDEVFGEENFISCVTVWKTSSQTSSNLASTSDYIVWFARNADKVKYRQLQRQKDPEDPSSGAADYKQLWLGFDRRKSIASASAREISEFKLFAPSPTTSQSGSETTRMSVDFFGKRYLPGPGGWKTNATGFRRLIASDRMMSRTNSLRYVRFLDDYPVQPIANLWTDVRWGFDATQKMYVVQTNPRVVERCLLMTTDPGDLVLDPTCGSGTTAYVAEQWGRRWITIDTSRVALALARARIMGAKYPWYLLKDSEEGVRKEAEVTRRSPATAATYNDIRHGFVYHRVPHITLKSIANNTEIDEIWAQRQPAVEQALADLNAALQANPPAPFTVQTGGRKGQKIDFAVTGTVTLPSGEIAPVNGLMEWEVPRDAQDLCMDCASFLPHLFADETDDTLLSWGVPEDWLDTVRDATEDTVVDIAVRLPSEAGDAILAAATGERPQPVPAVVAGEDPWAHPDALRRFRVVENVEELKAALDAPWEKWTVFLHPAQREFVERDFNGPARVIGSAGTGKTIVALHRAVRLAAVPDAKVLLTTFNRRLEDLLRKKLPLIAGQAVQGRIVVEALGSVIQRLHAEQFQSVEIVDETTLRTFLEEAANEVSLTVDPDFLFDEWTLIVDAWNVSDADAYRDLPRLGRKQRMAASRRDALWAVFAQTRRRLETEGLSTEAGCAHALRENGRFPFTHVIVDEAQDISVAELMLLGSMLGDRPNALFFAGDIGQRIFRAPFPWAAAGIEVRGRSRSLKVNYRTSHQIRKRSDTLLPETLVEADGSEASRLGVTSVFDGPAPRIRVFDDRETEHAELVDWVHDLVHRGVDPSEVAVLVRAPGLLPDFATLGVCVMTMHDAKGSEFRAVAIPRLDHDILPDEGRLLAARDEAQLDEIMITERHLLYVAATRARDFLWLSGVAPVSEFLSDLAAAEAAK